MGKVWNAHQPTHFNALSSQGARVRGSRSTLIFVTETYSERRRKARIGRCDHPFCAFCSGSEASIAGGGWGGEYSLLQFGHRTRRGMALKSSSMRAPHLQAVECTGFCSL